jgi:hypothetical protein
MYVLTQVMPVQIIHTVLTLKELGLLNILEKLAHCVLVGNGIVTDSYGARGLVTTFLYSGQIGSKIVKN